MEKIQKRLNALRNIQLEIDQAEAKLSDEIIQLELKHVAAFDALYKKRESIVTGEREPTAEEAKWDYENVNIETIDFTNDEVKPDQSKQPGIPGFWLRVLEQGDHTRTIICDTDPAILKHLISIKLKQNTQKPYGFTLEFHFEKNEYFKNEVLTKSYEFAHEKDKRNPLKSTNHSLYKCTGCEIEWNEGKGPAKEGDDDSCGSFFDFFRTHTPDGIRPAFKEKENKNGGGGENEDDDEDVELDHLFELDYEIGKFIKDMIIPKAVLFYTGEINGMEDEESDDDDDEGLDDDDDDDDDEESDEQDSKPTKKKVKTK